MKYTFPLAAVIALVLIAWIGSQIPGMQYLFGVALPYLAMALFVGGFCYRVIQWAKSPVPFKIPTTCGQGYSLPWIKRDKLESPNNTSEVVARMFLEIFLFRSLWRNTKSDALSGPKITYESCRWLWLFTKPGITTWCFASTVYSGSGTFRFSPISTILSSTIWTSPLGRILRSSFIVTMKPFLIRISEFPIIITIYVVSTLPVSYY